MSELHYDLIVIGSGQGGNPLASAFHAKGKRVAVIERGAVGGTCVNYGCTPTKTMVASAEVASLARRASEYGIEAGPVKSDMAAVVRRKRAIVDTWRTGSEKRFKQGIELIRGTGYFNGPKQVGVHLNDGGEARLIAYAIVINTGQSAAIPKIDGIEQVSYLTNESILELEQLPEHLLVLGGGYVGLEFAQMFRRFGSRVTVVQAGSQLLSSEDEDIAEEVASILRQDGIDIRLDSKAVSASSLNDGIRLTVTSKCESEAIDASHLLVATDRTPNTRELNLHAAGVELDAHGYVRVNERLETAAQGVYAIGDVNGGPAFTHISYDDFRILEANLLHGGSRTTKDRPLPYCVFIDPQLGRIGLSERAARAAGIRYKVAKIKMEQVARAYETNNMRGFMKALVDPDSKQILGAAVLGADGGELMSMIEIAMMGKLPYTALRDGVFAHPTFAESLNTLFASLDA